MLLGKQLLKSRSGRYSGVQSIKAWENCCGPQPISVGVKILQPISNFVVRSDWTVSCKEVRQRKQRVPLSLLRVLQREAHFDKASSPVYNLFCFEGKPCLNTAFQHYYTRLNCSQVQVNNKFIPSFYCKDSRGQASSCWSKTRWLNSAQGAWFWRPRALTFHTSGLARDSNLISPR